MALTLLSLGASEPVQATAFAGVSNAYWRVEFERYLTPSGDYLQSLPDGVTISCTGAAAQPTPTSCTDSASLSITNSSAQDLIATVGKNSGLLLTNTTDQDLNNFIFVVYFSAFNPGGSPVGASVDDPAAEYARFFSSVGGPGAGDVHGCDTAGGDNGASYRTPTECGVSAPDSSETEFAVGPLDAFQSIAIPYDISITVEARGAPEPWSACLLSGGLLGLVGLSRIKRCALAR